MIQLEKYREFLKIFKYAKFGNNLRLADEQGSFFDVDDTDVIINLYFEIDEIKELINLSKAHAVTLELAKSELLSNIYKVQSKKDKIHFISYILIDFLFAYKSFFDVYKQKEKDDCLFQSSKMDIDPYLIYTYIDLCYEVIQNWIKFILEIISLYKFKLIYNDSILKLRSETLDLLDIFNILFELQNPMDNEAK